MPLTMMIMAGDIGYDKKSSQDSGLASACGTSVVEAVPFFGARAQNSLGGAPL